MTTVNIQLNTKRLYQADGHAAKELLKLATLLTGNTKSPGLSQGNNDNDNTVTQKNHQVQDLRKVRELCSNITMHGSALHELISVEAGMKQDRFDVLTRNFDALSIEKSMQDANEALKRQIEQVEQQIANVINDEENLNKKIEQKKADLERSQKRLATLSKVRPVFMDEFERLEEDIKQAYDDYVKKFRSLAYLESELEKYEKIEDARIESQQQVVSEHNQQREDQADSNQPESTDLEEEQKEDRLEAVTTRVFGSMQADFDELESDASIDLNDDDLAEAELFSDEPVEVEKGDSRSRYSSRLNAARGTSKISDGAANGSDDDF